MADSYQDLQILGQGGMAKVFRAEDTELGRPVAIKELIEDAAASERNLVKFVAEGRRMASINHPNVVRIFAIEDPNDHPPRLIMELAEGTLVDHFQAGPMEPALMLRVARQLLQGLEAIHQSGYVHRDIKPANILYFDNGLFKIGDFGIAGTDDEQTQILATPKYMAPEVLTRPHRVGPAADLYSLGLTLYEALVGPERYRDAAAGAVGSMGENGLQGSAEGRHLWQMFHAGPESLPLVSELRPDIPGSLAQWLDRLLVKDPDARVQTAREALVTLDRVQPGGASPAASLAATGSASSLGVEVTQRLEPVVSRRLGTLQVVLLGVLVAILIGVGFLFLTAPRSITVEVVSEPSGAVVLFEGREKGHTPWTAEARSGTPLELRLDHFEPISFQIPEDAESRDERPYRIRHVLKWSRPVTVESRPAGARVHLRGDPPEELGVTPFEFQGSGAAGSLRLTLDGFEPVSLLVRAGRPMEPVIFRRALPRLQELSTPDALQRALDPFSDETHRLQLWGPAGPTERLAFGDRLRLRAMVTSDLHAMVFVLQSQGDILCLYPSPRAGALRLTAGEAVDLPLPAHVEDGYRLVASEPAGQDHAFLLTSLSPLPHPPRGQVIGSWSSLYPFAGGGNGSPAAAFVVWLADQLRQREESEPTGDTGLARLAIRIGPRGHG